MSSAGPGVHVAGQDRASWLVPVGGRDGSAAHPVGPMAHGLPGGRGRPGHAGRAGFLDTGVTSPGGRPAAAGHPRRRRRRRTGPRRLRQAEPGRAAGSTAPCAPGGHGRRACGRAMPRRGCHRARRRRWAAVRPRCTRIFSRTGISSPAASRLKMFSMEANLGSEPARPSSMEPRACLCGSLRLIFITSEAGA